MIELGGLPFFLVMAGCALLSQSALMHIIFAVAPNTGSWGFLLLGIEWRLMATYAFNLFMLAQQLEFRFGVMIKQDFLPVFIDVAGLAFLAVQALMLICLQVTSHTFMRRPFIFGRVGMALAALHFYVLAGEGKMRFLQAVIEFCFFPVTLVMAVFTIGAQATLVFIILAMTVIASRWRFTIFFLRLVTILALYFFLFLMSAEQGKVGLRVVEFIRIKDYNFRTSSFVFGMAGTAFFLLKPAVKSLVLL